MTTATRVHELAAEAYGWFESRERGDETIYTLKDGRPEWVLDLVRTAHGGDFLPDDWRYECIMDALGAIDDAGEDADETETADEFADQVDVYTHDLNRWYASNLNRAGYCDEAVSEGLAEPDMDITRRIALGQYMERREVFGLVWRELEDRAATLEADLGDDEGE